MDSATGESRSILNPATEELIAIVPESGEADIERAVAAASGAARGWALMTPAGRSVRLLELVARMEANAEELARIESRNVGKPIVAARDEVLGTIDHLRFFAGACRSLAGPTAGEYLDGFTSMVRREPIGLVAQIAPWNYPLQMGIWKVGPALAMGNVVVFKPSEQTPLSMLRVAELAEDLLPPGVFNVLTGGESVGAGLVRHRSIRMVSLTGDVATGKSVARAAADTLKHVHLELGGKAPVVVFDDASPTEVAKVLRVASFLNAGQDCTAACRVIAGSRVHDALEDALAETAASLRVGAPDDGDDVELGPVISAEQRSRVLGFVDRAADKGGRVVTGGSTTGSRGFFVEPTVISGVSQDDEIVQREVFGPVISLQRARSEDEAVAWANGVDYGLGASIFTRDVGRALRVARRLEFGTVWINDHLPTAAEMPFGGYKSSGYGRDLSVWALESYTQVKHVMASLY